MFVFCDKNGWNLNRSRDNCEIRTILVSNRTWQHYSDVAVEQYHNLWAVIFVLSTGVCCSFALYVMQFYYLRTTRESAFKSLNDLGDIYENVRIVAKGLEVQGEVHNFQNMSTVVAGSNGGIYLAADKEPRSSDSQNSDHSVQRNIAVGIKAIKVGFDDDDGLGEPSHSIDSNDSVTQEWPSASCHSVAPSADSYLVGDDDHSSETYSSTNSDITEMGIKKLKKIESQSQNQKKSCGHSHFSNGLRDAETLSYTPDSSRSMTPVSSLKSSPDCDHPPMDHEKDQALLCPPIQLNMQGRVNSDPIRERFKRSLSRECDKVGNPQSRERAISLQSKRKVRVECSRDDLPFHFRGSSFVLYE